MDEMDEMVEISEKSLKNIEKTLNQIIINLLHGGCSDPGWTECETAASLFKILKELNLNIKNEEGLVVELTKDNIHERNFLK